MKRRTARWVCLATLSLAAALAGGCGSDDASSSTKTAGDLEGRLATDTGVVWLVDRDEAGAPKFLTALTTPPPIATAGMSRDRAAVAFLQRYADLLGGGDLTRELVLVEDLEDRLLPGVHHLRFAQQIPGSSVRVLGADTFVHLDASGAVRFIAVGLVKDIAKISAHPAKTPEEARVAAESTVRARDPQAAISSPTPPVLVVHRAADGTGTLAWRITLTARVNGSLEAPEAIVDATNAGILVAHDTAAYANHTTNEAANFYLYHGDCGQKIPAKASTITYDDAFLPPAADVTTNRLQRDGDATHSTIITDRYLAGDLPTATFFTAPIVSIDAKFLDFIPGHQGSGAGVSTHENLALTDAFFRSLGQQGWDGTGSLPIVSAVHAWTIDPKGPKGPLPPAKVVDINGYLNDVIYLGDGIPPNDMPLGTPHCESFPMGVALDVVAHEFTHGIAKHSANLDLEGEAGALNEAIADALGAAAEHSQTPGDRNFIMGEAARFVRGGVRNLRSPRALPATFDNELVPRAYSERLSMTALDRDRGHVHDNSLIGSHAFFLMTVGGNNDVSHVSVLEKDALGWERSTWLWYMTLRALDKRFGSSFHDFARAQTNLAVILALPSPVAFPSATTAVACAWRAVEVFTDADLVPYGVKCGTSLPPLPPPAPSGGSSANEPNPCAAHGNDPVCDAAEPSSAVVCKNGVRVNVALCADLAQRCKKRSDSDPTASIDADGALVCE